MSRVLQSNKTWFPKSSRSDNTYCGVWDCFANEQRQGCPKVRASGLLKSRRNQSIKWYTMLIYNNHYYMASSASGQDDPNPWCDWLPEQARWSHLARLGLPAVSPNWGVGGLVTLLSTLLLYTRVISLTSKFSVSLKKCCPGCYCDGLSSGEAISPARHITRL